MSQQMYINSSPIVGKGPSGLGRFSPTVIPLCIPNNSLGCLYLLLRSLFLAFPNSQGPSRVTPFLNPNFSSTPGERTPQSHVANDLPDKNLNFIFHTLVYQSRLYIACAWADLVFLLAISPNSLIIDHSYTYCR